MEKTTIIKGEHRYATMLQHLDKFIERYVCCKNCNYPELKHRLEGKDLKSSCNSCGKTNTHDANHKAGKALVNFLKSGGGTTVDITKKDKVQQLANEEGDVEKVKKDKKSKKKNKDAEEEEEKEEAEVKEDISDADDELTWDSRRIGK